MPLQRELHRTAQPDRPRAHHHRLQGARAGGASVLRLRGARGEGGEESTARIVECGAEGGVEWRQQRATLCTPLHPRGHQQRLQRAHDPLRVTRLAEGRERLAWAYPC